MADREQDLAQFKRCFDENGSNKSIAQLRWQYLERFEGVGPLAAMGLANAADPDGSLSGIYAVFPNSFVISGERLLGAQSIDTLTAKDFRGKGIFNSLAEIVYNESSRFDIKFVYGFPNSNSAPGFFNKLGWTRLSSIPLMVKPLNLRFIVSKILVLKKLKRFFPSFQIYPKRLLFDASVNIEHDVPYDLKYSCLWQSYSRYLNIAVDRNSEYMIWRLNQKPEVRYSNLACFDGKGAMVAICIYTDRYKHEGHIGYIMDLIYDEDYLSEAQILLNNVCVNLAERNCDAILSWNFSHSPNNKLYKKSGFYKLPNQLRPIELSFGVRSFDGSLNNEVSTISNWYLSYLDSDTV